MPVYAFKAVDERGTKQKGVMEADNARHVRQQLRQRGLMPLEITESVGRLNIPWRAKGPRAAFSGKTIATFTRELAMLLEGGLQLEKALKLLAMQTDNAAQRNCLGSVHSQVVKGLPFAVALSQHPKDFPVIYRATVLAGEHAGDLVSVLNQLADYGETNQRTLGKVKLALLYPLILTLFSIVVVIGMMVFVFPDIARAFSATGQQLPFLTRVLIALSNSIRQFGALLLVALLGGVLALKRYFSYSEPRLKLHRFLLTVPVAGRVITSFNLARFTGTLSMLRNSGVPLADALQVSSGVLSNLFLKQAIEQVMHHVVEGATLSGALQNTKCFSPAYINMVAGGEASGELDRVLTLAARNQLRELESRVLFGVAILEPAIILTLGIVVLLVVLAIMMPILSMNQLVK